MVKEKLTTSVIKTNNNVKKYEINLEDIYVGQITYGEINTHHTKS